MIWVEKGTLDGDRWVDGGGEEEVGSGGGKGLNGGGGASQDSRGGGCLRTKWCKIVKKYPNRLNASKILITYASDTIGPYHKCKKEKKIILI